MRRTVGTAVLLFLSLAPVRGWAQAVDLLRPESVAGAAKKPPSPGGFPVQPGIYRLHGSDPGLPQDDLEPLRRIVGSAPVVALGESVHTSGGYYEMKHRAFRFLVEKMGFRVLAIESNWQNADRVNQYVQTCSGTPEEALRGIFSVWQSAETRDLVQWMCQWNRSHRKAKDKLSFFGFDVQQPEQDGAALIAFLERIGLDAGDPRIADLRRCDGVSAPSLFNKPVPEAQHQECTRGLDAVERLLAEDGNRIAAETSAQELEYAKLRRVGVKAWHDLVYHRGLRDYVGSVEDRDRGMAYAFQALRGIRFPKLKTAIWAHSFHIAKDANRTSWQVNTMGSFLSQALGSSYAAVALISNVTEIDWPTERGGRGCGQLDEFRHERTVEKILSDLGYPYLLVDLKLPGGLFNSGQTYRFSEASMVPGPQFDGAIFLERSRKMDPLAWPSCQ